MWTHPELFLTSANDRHRELIDEADKERLFSNARAARRARNAAAARGRPTDTPASYKPSAAVPAR